MPDFKKGDVVRLKSGGPQMTVAEVGDWSPTGPEDGVKCTWFEKTKAFDNVFDAAVLEHYKPAPIGFTTRRG